MRKLFLPLLLLFVITGCNDDENTSKWVKYEGNPVLGGPEMGTCFDVNVIPNGEAKYNMYFSWRPKKSIALTRSDDGINWSEPIIVLSEDSTSGWEDNINRSSTIFKDGKYYMWYTGQKDGHSSIGYTVSDDGIHFSRVQKDPVLTPEKDYEGVSVMNPYVLWDEDKEVYRMWYASGEFVEPNVICYAESKDGLNWTRYAGNPIFAHGEGEVWDKDRIGAVEVQKLKNGKYIMFYIGYTDINTARIGAAVSDDGITNWKRLKANPLVEPTPDSWDADACYKPSAVYDKENDRWLLWYNGRHSAPEYIGLAIHEGYNLGGTEE